MHHFSISAFAAVLLISAAPAGACEYNKTTEAKSAQVAEATAVDIKAAAAQASIELAAATEKKAAKKKKAGAKKEKVEYMRSAAGPEPKPAKVAKKKKAQ